jgi:ribosomal protein S18 acetylase RimI-like enzyme
MLFIILIILVILLFYLIRIQEQFTDSSIHSDLVNSCFSKNEINSFNEYYKFSKIIYGKNKKSVCYLTPTNVLNEIPIISWNGYYINNFCVDMAYRRQGYGTELLNNIINITKNEQKDHLILQVDNKNNSAKQLYYNMGFIDYFKGVDKNNNIKLYLVKYL